MMSLTREEQEWIDSYRKLLDQQFPDLVEDMRIFGSKARGDSHQESDLDVLLIIREGNWRVKHDIREPGYSLSIEKNVVPSILVYTLKEWNYRRE